MSQILVVDDHPGARAATAQVLRAAGHEVGEAATAADGVRLALAQRPALVLLDINLPNVDGVDAARRIRAEPSLADTMVIGLSAQATTPDDPASGLNAGADGYIGRPISNKEMLLRIDALLRQQRAAAALRRTETNLRAVIEQSADGMLVARAADRCVTFANPAAEQMLASAAGALVGREFALPITDAGRTEIDLRPDGRTPITVQMRCVPIEWAQQPAWLVSLHDITDTQRARAGEELRRLAAGIASLGGWSVDLATRQVSWSEEVARIHETPPGYAPTLDASIAFYAPEHRKIVGEAFARCAELGEPYDLKLQIVTARGRLRWVRTAGQVERDASGRMVRVFGALQDIHDNRLAELALERLNRLYALQSGVDEAIVAQPDDAAALLRGACQAAVELGRLQFAIVVEPTADGRVQPRCWAGGPPQAIEILQQQLHNPALTQWPFAQALAERRCLTLNEYMTDAQVEQWHPLVAHLGFGSCAIAPVALPDGAVLGLVLFAAEAEYFGSQEQRLLEAVGERLGNALAAIDARAQRGAAERALRSGEADLKRAQLAAGVGSWIGDPATDALQPSAGTLRLLGLAPAEAFATGRAFLEYVHPDDRALVRRAIHAAATGYDFECRVVRNDGGITWLHVRGEVEADAAGQRRTIGSVLDITERKRDEQRLRTQLERLELLRRITGAVGERLELDRVLEIVAEQVEAGLPAALCALLVRASSTGQWRLAATGAAGRALAERAGLEPAVALTDEGATLRACRDGATVHLPTLADAPDALARRLAVAGLGSAVFAPLHAGEVFGVLIVARLPGQAFSPGDRDFVHQLSEHTALAAQQARLYGSLRDAYDTLSRSQAAMLQRERLAALGSLAGGIAHDLNNALAPAVLYLESLLARDSALSDPVRERLHAVQRAVDAASGTVVGLREFARPGDAGAARHRLDLRRLVQQVVELTRARWRDQAQQRGAAIDVVLELANDLPAVDAVEGEVRDALVNLVFNAVDAMPAGGTLTLQVRAAPGDGPGGGVVVTVGDTGVGMDAHTRQRCVEPFFTTKGEHGAGLGLAMVWGIAERHQATLHVDSEPGRGTCVSLRFPTAAAPRASTSDARLSGWAGLDAGPDSERPPPLRLLLVDDDATLLQALAQVLRQDGHDIVTACGGPAGLEAFEQAGRAQRRFDAVVTDLGMPDVDGHAVARAVKAAAPGTPVIMLTGWGRGMPDGVRPDGVDSVLPKPPRLRQLRQALCAAVAAPGVVAR